MVAKLKKALRLSGPLLFFLGLAYTAFYPEKKLLGPPSRLRSNTITSLSTPTTPFELGDSSSGSSSDEASLSKCRVWIELSSSNLPDALTSCTVESAMLQMKNTSHSICIVIDRFVDDADHFLPWLDTLKKRYGDLVVKHIPEYGSAFAGTLFEETYVNSADLSFMGPAMIWALVWKHGGLFISPGTFLLSTLKTYYNFIVLNSYANGSSMAMAQFTDRHHDLPGLVLNHFMEQARRLKQIARERQGNIVQMGVPGVSDNARLVFSYITEQEFSREVEVYCGRALTKSLARHLCQDTEVVAAELVPTFDAKSILGLSKNNLSEMLAIHISSSVAEEEFEHILRSSKVLKTICPITYSTNKAN